MGRNCEFASYRQKGLPGSRLGFTPLRTLAVSMTIRRPSGIAGALLAGLGFALLAISWRIDRSRVDVAAIAAAIKPLAEDSLTAQPDRAQSLTIEIPNTPAWTEMRREFGDPDYLIARSARAERLECLDQAELDVKAKAIDLTTVRLGPARHVPYGYSADCANIGYTFRALPGTSVQLTIACQTEPVCPSGDILVIADWPGDIKDKIVGADLREGLTVPVRMTVIAGTILVVGGILLLAREFW